MYYKGQYKKHTVYLLYLMVNANFPNKPYIFVFCALIYRSDFDKSIKLIYLKAATKLACRFALDLCFKICFGKLGKTWHQLSTVDTTRHRQQQQVFYAVGRFILRFKQLINNSVDIGYVYLLIQ